MFGNAFPAEITSALRTPSHSFSLPVIITSLMSQVLHNIFLKIGHRFAQIHTDFNNVGACLGIVVKINFSV